MLKCFSLHRHISTHREGFQKTGLMLSIAYGKCKRAYFIWTSIRLTSVSTSLSAPTVIDQDAKSADRNTRKYNKHLVDHIITSSTYKISDLIYKQIATFIIFLMNYISRLTMNAFDMNALAICPVGLSNKKKKSTIYLGHKVNKR